MEFGNEHDTPRQTAFCTLLHAGPVATNHALARYDIIIYVFHLHSLLGRTVWRKPHSSKLS